MSYSEVSMADSCSWSFLTRALVSQHLNYNDHAMNVCGHFPQKELCGLGRYSEHHLLLSINGSLGASRVKEK